MTCIEGEVCFFRMYGMQCYLGVLHASLPLTLAISIDATVPYKRYNLNIYF